MQPINYGAYFQRPKTQDLGLYDYVKEIEGIRRERDFRNDLADLQGNYTSEKAANMMLKHPEFQQQMLQPFKHLDAANQESMKNNLVRLEMVKGNPEKFKGMLSDLHRAHLERGDAGVANIFGAALEDFDEDPQAIFDSLNTMNIALGGSDYAMQQAEIYAATQLGKQRESLSKSYEEDIKNKIAERKKMMKDSGLGKSAIKFHEKALEDQTSNMKNMRELEDTLSQIPGLEDYKGGAYEVYKDKFDRWWGLEGDESKKNKQVYLRSLKKFALKEAFKLKQAGAMSDAEFNEYIATVPTETDDPGVVMDYMKKAYDFNRYNYGMDEIKIKFIEKFGNTKSATRDEVIIEGLPSVKKGQTFNSYALGLGDKLMNLVPGIKSDDKPAGLTKENYLGEWDTNTRSFK